jgi:type IV pilus assembly protein PilB
VEPDPDITREKLEAAGMSAREAAACKPKGGRGCGNCSETGYKGRLAVYEVMVLSETLREFVLNGASSAEIRKEAVREGMKTLRQSSLTKLMEGVTTLSEVFRISAADH